MGTTLHLVHVHVVLDGSVMSTFFSLSLGLMMMPMMAGDDVSDVSDNVTHDDDGGGSKRW